MMAIPHSTAVLTAVDVGDRALLIIAMLAHLVQECWRPAQSTTTFWTPTGGLGSSRQNVTMEHGMGVSFVCMLALEGFDAFRMRHHVLY